ncbi:hypothetical protein AVT29_gp57 [Streptomyces phage Amela]|uniref:Uncharacterized protein n=1 Tax=Streptomyces phage Amela TaxID=1673877 RepID=A0A0K1Y9P6_9CAUD|nr:hypothetical protein AVT29_gp57 [Streptomyces phage Amela]AKY03812.1 hypothetical protein SEA_AMELA_57 [Streptomyces phage Amela]
MSYEITPEDALLAITQHLGLPGDTKPAIVLDLVEELIVEHRKLRLRHAAMIRRAQSQHPNTLAAVAAAFARRAD